MRIRAVNLRHVGGLIVVGAACLFVADKIISTQIWTLAETNGRTILVAVLVGAAAYGLSGFLLSAAWRRILRWCGQDKASMKLCFCIYARTQIAKYIPGNIFHFIGRHAMGRRFGFGHTPMVSAAVLEGIGLILAAGLLALVGALVWLEPRSGLAPAKFAALGAILLLVPYALAYGLPRFARARRIEVEARRPRDTVTGLIPAYLLQISFFLLSGCILWGLALVVGDVSLSALPPTVTAVAAAWVAGFVTPGAAAGIGVREAVLIAALSGTLGEREATLIAVAYRAVTLSGDLFFFALSFPLILPTRRAQM